MGFTFPHHSSCDIFTDSLSTDFRVIENERLGCKYRIGCNFARDWKNHVYTPTCVLNNTVLMCDIVGNLSAAAIRDSAFQRLDAISYCAYLGCKTSMEGRYGPRRCRRYDSPFQGTIFFNIFFCFCFSWQGL